MLDNFFSVVILRKDEGVFSFIGRWKRRRFFYSRKV